MVSALRRVDVAKQVVNKAQSRQLLVFYMVLLDNAYVNYEFI